MRKNVSGQKVAFRLVSSADGESAVAGATVTVRRCLDGTWGNVTGTVAEPNSGEYVFSPSQADTNGNEVTYTFVATGAITLEKSFSTTAADPSDANGLGLTYLDASVTSRAPSNTALLNTTWQDSRAAFLDASVSTRAPTTSLTSGVITLAASYDPAKTAAQASVLGTPAGASVSADIATRAPSSTALLNTDWQASKALFLDASVSSRASLTNLSAGIVTLSAAYDAAKTAAQAGDQMDLVDAPNATAIAAIQDGLSTLAASDLSVYHARINFERTSTTDYWTVVWFKNGIKTAATSGTIQLINLDNTDLLASTAMTGVAGSSSAEWKYSETSSRLTVGTPILCRVTCTMDAATRTFEEPVSRDSA